MSDIRKARVNIERERIINFNRESKRERVEWFSNEKKEDRARKLRPPEKVRNVQKSVVQR